MGPSAPGFPAGSLYSFGMDHIENTAFPNIGLLVFWRGSVFTDPYLATVFSPGYAIPASSHYVIIFSSTLRTV
jgi:hypothetical protein